MESELPSTLRNLARLQNGVVSRSQALRTGLTEDMIKFRVRSDRWRQIHPGVYATFTGVAGRGAQLWAVLLSAGPGAILSHETAAELLRLADEPSDAIHVIVPWQRRIAAPPWGQPAPFQARWRDGSRVRQSTADQGGGDRA